MTDSRPLDPALTLQTLLDETLRAQPQPRLLEAGCGSVSNLRIPPGTHVVGLDISAKQLELNEVVTEKIQGDVQSHPLPPGHFDAIICWDVLEHVPEPERALANLAAATRENGILILAFPNVMSVKGLVAKMTPYKTHRLVYRFIYGSLLGEKGFEPFPTYLRLAIAPAAVRRFSHERGLKVEMELLYESGMQRRFRNKIRLTGPLWGLAAGTLRFLTAGRISAEATDCLFVLRRPAA